MKWRTILGVTLGLLLPLPFLLDHCSAALREHQARAFTPPSGRLVPILARNERHALPTYGRSCESQKDCDAPLVCLDFFSGEERVCIGSECRTDRQCEQGFTCRTRKAPEEEALVGQCVLIGTQKEGQPCRESAAEPELACAQGLLCGGDQCGRPCQLDMPSSCPRGFVCRAGPDTPSCQPFCEADGDCPEGQACVGAGTDKARCMLVHGENCQRRPCPEGQQCHTLYAPGAEAWTARMECVRLCDEQRTCPEGSVCFLGGCRRTCGLDGGDVCGPGRRCVQFPSDHLWLCESASG